jgi:L-alanine-DL-glutamate epimerase-like enolase superfamily enzyme
VKRTLETEIECWALRTPFRIARGTRTSIDVVVATIREGDAVGRGEATPTARYGENPDLVREQIAHVAAAICESADRAALLNLLPPGSARNAIDAALWDLEAKKGGAWASNASSLVSAQTLSIDTPSAMGFAAADLAEAQLVKVKVDGTDPAACLRAVRKNLPDATLIVDANEGWTIDLLAEMQPVLSELSISLLEQPLPAGEDDALRGFKSAIPLCADESCHVAADVERLRELYGFINVKLDKAGGLTEGLALVKAAREADMGVMVGCMLATSLGIAPALRLAALADYADLDGPWWLTEDRVGGLRISADGSVRPPQAGFWGDAGRGRPRLMAPLIKGAGHDIR